MPPRSATAPATSAPLVTMGGMKITITLSTWSSASSDVERAFEVVGAGRREHVDRIADGRRGRQERAQGRGRLVG